MRPASVLARRHLPDAARGEMQVESFTAEKVAEYRQKATVSRQQLRERVGELEACQHRSVALWSGF